MPQVEVEEKTEFEYNELSEDAKRKAVQNMYDINVDHDWWDTVYENAAEIGCEIKGFDLGWAKTIDLMVQSRFYDHDVAKKILENHGNGCDTYQVAASYLFRWKFAADQDEFHEENTEDFQEKIAKCYLNALDQEYEYLTNDESIIESIGCNGYLFDEDGNHIG